MVNGLNPHELGGEWKLGFTIHECGSLLSLYQDKNRASSDVKSLALEKVTQIEKRLEELKNLSATLTHLAENCQGNNRPDCPILDELSGTGTNLS